MLQEVDPDPELKSRSWSVSPLGTGRDAIVELDPGNSAQLEGEAKAITESKVLDHLELFP